MQLGVVSDGVTLSIDDVLGEAIPDHQQVELQRLVCMALGKVTGQPRRP